MAKLPSLKKIQAHLQARNVVLSAATPVKPHNSSARPIALQGSIRPIDNNTLSRIYDPSSTYNDPGTAFGPGTPPIPQPLDNTGQPRREYYPPGHNLMGYGLGRPIDPGITQSLVDHYDLFRQALYVRIDELACMDWDIIPDPLIIRTVKERRDVQEQYRDRITAARQFFKKPDKYNPFQVWVRNILEDHFIFDAITLYKRRTRGGGLYALEYLDGSLIKSLFSVEGRRPEPPEPAYQQYVLGVPRFEFTTDELIYMPKNVRPRNLIGFSVVEQFILHINTALRFQAWNTAFFTDGNIPSRLLTAPDNWTADKIEEWQQIWDALLAGDPTAQRKLFMVPPGVKEIGGGNEGQFDYATEFSKYLIDITCVATGVTRQELGLEPGNSEGLGGSGLHEAMASTQNHRLVRLANFLADTVFTPLLQEEFGLDHFVWQWPDLEKQDPQAHAELNQLLMFSGQKSFDEILMEQGQEPIGVGRMINNGGKLIFEKDLLKLQAQGTLAFEQEQAETQAQNEADRQKDLAEHANELQQQQAEHAAGLQQEQAVQQQELAQQGAEHAAGLQQQQAEQQATLQQEQMEQQAGLQQQQAEQQAGLEQQQATHQAGLEQQQAQTQAGLEQQQAQTQGDMDLNQEQYRASLTQQEVAQQSQVAAQQSQQEHQQHMEETDTAAAYAREQALMDYAAKTGGQIPHFLAAAPASAPVSEPMAHEDRPVSAPAGETFNPNATLDPMMALTPDELMKSAQIDIEAAKLEMEQWRRKLEKGLKAGKSPSTVPFTPNIIGPDQYNLIQAQLIALQSPTVPEIRTIFKSATGDIIAATLA